MQEMRCDKRLGRWSPMPPMLVARCAKNMGTVNSQKACKPQSRYSSRLFQWPDLQLSSLSGIAPGGELVQATSDLAGVCGQIFADVFSFSASAFAQHFGDWKLFQQPACFNMSTGNARLFPQ